MKKPACLWEKARPVAAAVAALLMMLRGYVMTVTLVDDAGSPRQVAFWLQVGTIAAGGCLGFVATSFAFPSCFWCDVRRTHWRELCESVRNVARDIAWVGRGVTRLWRNMPSMMSVLMVFLVVATGVSVFGVVWAFTPAFPGMGTLLRLVISTLCGLFAAGAVYDIFFGSCVSERWVRGARPPIVNLPVDEDQDD